MPPPTLEEGGSLIVASFDGSARIPRKEGVYIERSYGSSQNGRSCVSVESRFVTDSTENEAEYNGMLLCFDLLADLDRGRVIICGDSNLVIQQMRGETDCKAPGLQLLRHRALENL